MENPITVAQALRHARHDFLNELQLIQMKLDLGRGQDVKSMIRSHAEAAVQRNRLMALRMPATEEWLLTAEWRFPEFRFDLQCAAREGVASKDTEFAQWLEDFFRNLKAHIDDTADLNCRVTVKEHQKIFIIELDLTGNAQEINLQQVPGLLARQELAADNTKIFVSAQMEG